ncbi:MAG: AAA family ATPase [Burkholderiales bacterium]
MDEANACLLRDGEAVPLAPTPFAVLCALVRQPGLLLTKNALLDQVWGHQFVSESVLKTVVSELRTILKDDARKPRFIETVSRRGYRFIAPTTAAIAPGRAGAAKSGSSALPSFIGRTDALPRLAAQWDLACTGKRTVVWVTGEPGIGKTTLIEHFIAGLGDVVCARGQCVEQYGMGESYLPVLEALAELCRIDRAVAPLLRAVAPTWLLQLPWLGTAEERDALRRELAGVTPDRMLREMGEMLARYTEEKPLLLVTEDLHWSDRATLQLIDYVARRRGNARLMWLASFRLAEVIALDHPLNRLRHELRLHGLCEEIVLDPFSESEVADYVAQYRPSIGQNEAFVRALHERTDGLPLFVASVMSDVAAQGAQDHDDAAASERLAKMGVPENLAAIIDHYIARLGADQRAVLQAAAICGADFRVGTVSAVLERDAAWVGQTCEALLGERRWLVARRVNAVADETEQSYSFRHALFRQVLYERTAPSDRAKLHRKAGTALERERAAGAPTPPAEIAMHFERGRDVMAALRYYAEAADAALAHLSPGECMNFAERALTLLDQAPESMERTSLEITLATLRGISATQVLGVTLEAKSAFQRAYALVHKTQRHPALRRLMNGFGFLLCLRADYNEALTVAERAETLSAETHDPVLTIAASIVHGEVHQLQGQSREARKWIERGLAAAEALDVAPAETSVADPQVTLLGLSAIELLRLGMVEQGRARMDLAHARARQLNQPMSRLVAIWFDALFQVRLGNAQCVAALADEMRSLVDAHALAHGRTGSRWFRGWADARMGEPREGYRRIREAYEENARLGMLAGGSEVLGYAAEALLLAGELDAAHRQVAEAFEVAKTLDERVYLPQLYLIEGSVAGARGESAAARASFRRAVAEARRQEAPWLELMALLELCERKDAAVNNRQALAELVDRLPEAAGTTAVARAQALLGKTKAA